MPKEKIRIIRTSILEYFPEPNYYEGCITIEDMAKVDVQTDDTEMLFSSENITETISYEIIREEDDGTTTVIARGKRS